MALSQTAQIALSVVFFGSLAFILAVVAENKKPPFGTPIEGKGVIICKYPKDPTIALGALSIVTAIITTLLGVLAVFFPYKGKSVPRDVLFRSTVLLVFFTVAVLVTLAGEGMLLWATVTEAVHRIRNVHQDLDAECATAKTGLFGGGAFLVLDAALFWLVCQMLTLNAREDYFEEDDPKGEYGEVLTVAPDDVGGASSPARNKFNIPA